MNAEDILELTTARLEMIYTYASLAIKRPHEADHQLAAIVETAAQALQITDPAKYAEPFPPATRANG